ncbi:MAG: hypothetical protein LAT83_22625 [Kiritimatiellae bacterium]|nr:hypothetical protein [Kiritimatiellia bacterium]
MKKAAEKNGVWSRYFTPRDVVGRWVTDRFGEPVVIGGVTLRTGDYLMADGDGSLVIPQLSSHEVEGSASMLEGVLPGDVGRTGKNQPNVRVPLRISTLS